MSGGAERPAELRHNSVNSWSHLNSDDPVQHSHGFKISRYYICAAEEDLLIPGVFSILFNGNHSAFASIFKQYISVTLLHHVNMSNGFTFP